MNPYSGRVYEHPEVLLPHPRPEEIRARVEAWRARPMDPSDSKELESRQLVVDLGCGSGNFLRDLAARRPQDLYLGFELRFKRLVRGAEKLERQG
ncbi:MAG: tRNA (guanosine(46)-N7)-methyltransferase TrmB, partial [Deltaproteobacteria bacterium]|nr:tRNA (guanosine(46)-N7)-methyltransferase TrmB [Deltaproteobacteria bacterium]